MVGTINETKMSMLCKFMERLDCGEFMRYVPNEERLAYLKRECMAFADKNNMDIDREQIDSLIKKDRLVKNRLDVNYPVFWV